MTVRAAQASTGHWASRSLVSGRSTETCGGRSPYWIWRTAGESCGTWATASASAAVGPCGQRIFGRIEFTAVVVLRNDVGGSMPLPNVIAR